MRLIPQCDNMSDLLAQPYPASAPQSWSGARPQWSLQGKHRNQHDRIAEEKSTITKGWDSFFAPGTEGEAGGFRVGDTSRRHLTRPGATETAWKPCFKLVAPQPHSGHAFGKKAVPPPQLSKYPELTDIPQGKKHIQPPVDQLPQEMPLFQLRHKVRDQDGSSLVAQRIADPNVTEPPRGPRLVPMADRRNGVPVTSGGDKPYSAVELSMEYAASMGSTRPRLGLEKIAPEKRPMDQWAAKQRVINRSLDVARVRALPNIGGGDDD